MMDAEIFLDLIAGLAEEIKKILVSPPETANCLISALRAAAQCPEGIRHEMPIVNVDYIDLLAR